MNAPIFMITLLILLGVSARSVSLHDPGGRAMAFRAEIRSGAAGIAQLRKDPDRVLTHPLAAAASSELAEIPRTQLQDAWLEWFDLEASVLLTAGADRAPGRAGVDDDFDGVIDNPSELGAVGSDDRCVTPVDPEFDAESDRPFTREVGEGAYVPWDEGPREEATIRLVLEGMTRGRQWVWPVELRSPTNEYRHDAGGPATF